MPATSSAPGSQPQTVARKNQATAAKQAIKTATRIGKAATGVAASIAAGASAVESAVQVADPTSQVNVKAAAKAKRQRKVMKAEHKTVRRLVKNDPPKAEKLVHDTTKRIWDRVVADGGSKAPKIELGQHTKAVKAPKPTVTISHADARKFFSPKAKVRKATRSRVFKAAVKAPAKAPTPQERTAAKTELKAAAKKSLTKVSHPSLGPRQEKFVSELAKRTGLDPRVLAGQAASEQPADSPSITGSDNWLNIGYFSSGPTSTTAAKGFFEGPKQAAKLTAKFFKGKELGASEGIQNVLSTAGKSPQKQIAALQNSGWAGSGYPDLPSLAAETTVKRSKPIPKKVKQTAKEVLGPKKTKEVVKKAQGTTAASPAPKKLKGPLGGSREMVRQIVGSQVKGDHGYSNEGSVHSASGDHYGPGSYAQDINNPAGDKAEGEPPYTQATLDKMVANLRKLGADVPALKIGQNWEGSVKGYAVQLLTNEGGTVNHIHIGAHWEGTPTSTGSASGAATGYAPSAASGGTAALQATTRQAAAATRGGKSAKKRKARKLEGRQRSQLLRKLIAQGPAPAEQVVGKAPTITPAARPKVTVDL